MTEAEIAHLARIVIDLSGSPPLSDQDRAWRAGYAAGYRAGYWRRHHEETLAVLDCPVEEWLGVDREDDQ